MSNDPIKDVLKRMPYGFYAITTTDGQEVNAMVANWVTQASFTPRQLALAIQKSCYSMGLMQRGRVFAVNIFNKEDVDAIRPFTKGRSRNPEKMEGVSYTAAPETGCPILAGAAAYLECRIVAIVDGGGDHNLVLGTVVGGGIEKAGEVAGTLSLLDLGWSYAG